MAMENARRRPPESNLEEKLADSSSLFDERISLAPVTVKTYEDVKTLRYIAIDEATNCKRSSLQILRRSPRWGSKSMCEDISDKDSKDVVRVNEFSTDSYPRRPQTRSASKIQGLPALVDCNDCEILNRLNKTTVPYMHKSVRVNTLLAHKICGKISFEINGQLGLNETVHSSAPEQTKRKIFSLRTRTSADLKLVSPASEIKVNRLHPEESVRSLKRFRKDEIIEINPFDAQELLKLSNAWDLTSMDDLPRLKAKQKLLNFHSIYNRLSQEADDDLKLKFEFQKNRLDLMALKLLKVSCADLNFDSISVGSVPGIEVGDEFNLRVELRVLGIHCQLMGNVDFCKQDGRLLTRSIISSCSRRHSDGNHASEVLIYPGSGAPTKNQKLEYGNLALKNSIDAQNPIRIILGFEDIQIGKSQRCNGRKAFRYIYDGLYFAEKYWTEKNDDNCDVFMFQLRRQREQPELKLKKVKLRTSISFSDICVEDISNGKEKMPICVVNTIDKSNHLPFIYTKDMIYPRKHAFTLPKGCNCVGICTDSIKCACAVKNGGELPFNGRGSIVQAKPLVYECGPSCKCPPSCHNRVSQHGIKFPLEVFKTETMGWGLRSLFFIPSGSFVCEYIGELINDDVAQKRANDEYLFAIGNNYHDASLWEGLSTSIPELQKKRSSKDKINYAVDASRFGNVARFINHSCMPNLYAQNLLFDHGNKSTPHIMLFAAEDIPPLQELTYHYNYTVDQVHDSNGNLKQKICYCGTIECTGRLY